MITYKCKMCGGTLNIDEGKTTCECEYCGSVQTVPTVKDDITINQFNRANNLRLKCEFDKAEAIYEKIVEQDDSNAEAHWGIVLCKYGIEYVDDPLTKKKIPTCHRTSYSSITTDADYQAAIDYSDTYQQTIYENEARAIDKIQKDILSIVKNEKPFDVFICYKETDENGKRTVDSVIANDIYHQLTQEGFKVFYAAITLEDKLGQEYEPYIFAALNSAKVMLSIGTKPECFNAVWVKNEWSRYLALMKTDRSKLLIPCYRDMDAYDLPEEFSHLQAQDMSKIGFINDVVRGIKKVIVKDEAKTEVPTTTIINQTNGNVSVLLKRIFIELEDKQFENAESLIEQVLNIEPENEEGYLAKLLCEFRVSSLEELSYVKNPFNENRNFQRAMQFADETLKSKLTETLEKYNENKEYNRLNSIYEAACLKLQEAIKDNCQDGFDEAEQQFASIENFKDSKEKIKECKFRYRKVDYDDALSCMQKKTESYYNVALFHFKEIMYLDGYEELFPDLQEKITECENAIKEIIYQSSLYTITNRNYIGLDDAKKKLESIIDYKDARELAEKCTSLKKELEIEREKNAKANKRKFLIVGILSAIVIALMTFYSSVIVPSNNYKTAMAAYENNNYIEAYKQFSKYPNYKDTQEKISELIKKESVLSIYSAQKGDIVKYGKYKGETITWKVLENSGNKVFLISEYILDEKQFDKSTNKWENSSIRSWLNGSFYNDSFSTNEKKLISNQNGDNVFLLSVNEVKKYFSSDDARKAKGTSYVKNNRLIEDTNGYYAWWLRTAGTSTLSTCAAYVNRGGDVIPTGFMLDYIDLGVRPALWISIK